MSKAVSEVKKVNIVEEFMNGAKKGFYIAVELIAPAMVMAYVLINFLKITGLLDIMGKVVAPVMAVFGLPGEAIVVLISAFFAKAGGGAAAAMLYSQGVINAAQATILFPAVIVMGTLLGHYVRIVVVANTNKKWHKFLIAIPLIDAAIVMLITRLILVLTGKM